MKARDLRLQVLRKTILEIPPVTAVGLQQQGATLVDVREQDEITRGSPQGALHLSRSHLELNIEQFIPDMRQTILLICGSGKRSLLAADDLKRMGYQDVRSVNGGFTRWRNDGQPFAVPRLLDANARERYARHLLLPEVGEAGQLKLLDSKVLIIGAGGLGSPAALYLAAAGTGTMGLVDNDIVDRSNLQRQILHTDAGIGTTKVGSARERIKALNPTVKVIEYETRLTNSNVEEIFSDYDVVVDGSDNFPTRYLVNDACVKLGLPNVHAAVYRFEGQVTVFWPAHEMEMEMERQRGPCYRCMYPQPPPPELTPSCDEIGVLGVLPGVLGLLQAVEAIKIMLNIGDILVGRMLYYEALRARFTELRQKRDPACRCCGDKGRRQN